MNSSTAPSSQKSALSRLRGLLFGGSSAEAEKGRKRAALLHRAVTAAVRDTLATAGILSSQYRIKVLSTVGSQSRIALVVNMLEGAPLSVAKMGELERRTAAHAASRSGPEIIAIYWRWNQFVTDAPKPAPSPVPSPSPVAAEMSAEERTAQAFARAEAAMRKDDDAWASTTMDDDYTPPEASNSDLMPLM